jgi:hypothetical protein
LWNKTKLSACFASTSFGTGTEEANRSLRIYGETQVNFTGFQMKFIKQALDEEFKFDKTGMEVSVSDLCPIDSDKKFDLVIIGSARFLKTKRKALAHSTRGWKKNRQSFIVVRVKKNQFDNIYNDNYTDGRKLGAIMTHEVGHTMGMIHDHEMGEALMDPNCQKTFKDKGKVQKTNHYIDGGITKGNNNTRFLSFSGYDSESIMSYCFLRNDITVSSRVPFLSKTDQEALFSIYGGIKK